jgi:hypothetical protein
MRLNNSVSFVRKQVYLHYEQHNKLSTRYDTNEHKTFTKFLFVKYIKASRNKSEDLEGEWNVGLTFLTVAFGTTRTAELAGLRNGRTLPPRKILGNHIC